LWIFTEQDRSTDQRFEQRAVSFRFKVGQRVTNPMGAVSDSIEEALSSLATGAIASAYVLWGEEFLVRKASQSIIDALLPEADRSFSLVRLDLASPREVLAELETMPMFGTRKVVWVHEPDFLSPAKARPEGLVKAREAWKNNRRKEAARRVLTLAARAGWTASDISPSRSGSPKASDWDKQLGIALAAVDLAFLEEVAAYCESEALSVPPTDDEGLSRWIASSASPRQVLLITATELETKHQLFKGLKKHGVCIERRAASKLKELDLTEFAHQALAPFNKKMAPGALERLKERVGGNFRLLQSELEKLALHTDKDSISVRDVELLAGHAREDEYFELSEAISKRNFEAALKYVTDAVANGAHPIALLGSIASLVRNLTLGYERMAQISKGKPPRNYNDFQARIFPAIEAEAKASKSRVPHPYAAFMSMQAAAQFGRKDLLNALSACADADLALKLGGGLLILERLLWTVCGKSERWQVDMHGIRREMER
jgi:DNA polymerase III subunit delta